MALRLMVIDLVPGPFSRVRPNPLAILPVGPDRVAVALDESTPEEVLAELLARGLRIRRSVIVET